MSARERKAPVALGSAPRVAPSGWTVSATGGRGGMAGFLGGGVLIGRGRTGGRCDGRPAESAGLCLGRRGSKARRAPEGEGGSHSGYGGPRVIVRLAT